MCKDGHTPTIGPESGAGGQVRKLHCDVVVANVDVNFSGAAQPIAASDLTIISGTIAVGRQVGSAACISS